MNYGIYFGRFPLWHSCASFVRRATVPFCKWHKSFYSSPVVPDLYYNMLPPPLRLDPMCCANLGLSLSGGGITREPQLHSESVSAYRLLRGSLAKIGFKFWGPEPVGVGEMAYHTILAPPAD